MKKGVNCPPKGVINIYVNATVCKMKNIRVHVERFENGDFGIMFKRLICDENDANTPTAKSFNEKGKIKKTVFTLSPEAAHALFHTLGRELNKKAQ